MFAGIEKNVDSDRLSGRNIRLNRIREGLSQLALGERIGVTCRQVQKYETGANRVPASRLIHIAGALDVPVVALLGNRATDDGKFDRAALECRRRLSCAVESISDARLLNLAVELIEGMAKL